jgi:hypothetical protein
MTLAFYRWSLSQEVPMARWMIAATMIAIAGAPLCAAAQDRAAPPLFSPSPNAECQRQTGGLPPSSPGETTGSANLSDQLSRSKGVICPPAGIDPGLTVPPVGGGITPVIPPPGTPGGDPGLIPK